jgi:hypothetical protein
MHGSILLPFQYLQSKSWTQIKLDQCWLAITCSRIDKEVRVPESLEINYVQRLVLQ